MPNDVVFDWDEWNVGWAESLVKNEMWHKVRSGENDPVTGEPLFRYAPPPEQPERPGKAKK